MNTSRHHFFPLMLFQSKSKLLISKSLHSGISIMYCSFITIEVGEPQVLCGSSAIERQKYNH